MTYKQVTWPIKSDDLWICEHSPNDYLCHYLLDGTYCQIYPCELSNNFAVHFLWISRGLSEVATDSPALQGCRAFDWVKFQAAPASGYFVEGWNLWVCSFCVIREINIFHKWKQGSLRKLTRNVFLNHPWCDREDLFLPPGIFEKWYQSRNCDLDLVFSCCQDHRERRLFFKLELCFSGYLLWGKTRHFVAWKR